MKEVRLGDVVSQIRGVSYKPEDLHGTLNNESVILLRANNIQDGKIVFDDVLYVSKNKVNENQYIKRGDILVCSSSGSKNLVGKAAYAVEDINAVFGAFCRVIGPHVEFSEFIGHFFNSVRYRERISHLSRGSNINNIRNEDIDGIKISIPSISEQRAISNNLNLLSQMYELRHQQLAKLDQLVKARFVEMFGDPTENPFKWPTKSLLAMGYCKNGMNFHKGDSGIVMHCLGVGDFKDYSIIDGTDNLSR